MSLLVTCLLIVLGALGYGAFERHQGAQQEAARQHADSLLALSKAESLTIALQDSIRSRVAQDSLQRLNVEIRTTKHLVSQAQVRGDSIAEAISGDSVVPRDSVEALIGAFQAERAASAQQVSQLEAANAVLTAEVAGKDSTIQALTVALAGARAGWAQALKPTSPGIFDKALRLGEAVLAVRGALAFAIGK